MKHFVQKRRNVTVLSTASGESLATNLKGRIFEMEKFLKSSASFIYCFTKKFTERETQKCKSSNNNKVVP